MSCIYQFNIKYNSELVDKLTNIKVRKIDDVGSMHTCMCTPYRYNIAIYNL